MEEEIANNADNIGMFMIHPPSKDKSDILNRFVGPRTDDPAQKHAEEEMAEKALQESKKKYKLKYK